MGPQSYHKIKKFLIDIGKKSEKFNLTEFEVIEKFDNLNSLKNSDNKVSTFLTIQRGVISFANFVLSRTRGVQNFQDL